MFWAELSDNAVPVVPAPADSFSAFRAPDTVTKAQQAVERKPAKPYTLNTQRTIVGESPHPPDGRPSPAGPSPAVSHPDTPVDHLLDEVRRPASRHKASIFFLESFLTKKVVQPAEPRSSKKRGFGDASEAVSAWSTDLDAGLVRSHSAGYAPLVLSISAICARSDSVVPGFCSARMRGGQRR